MEKTKWIIDGMHSEVQFKVKHLVISTVTGKFDQFDAKIEATDDSFADSKVEFSAQIDSINTGVGDRDNHLKSDDFFKAEKFPELKFKSTGMTKKGDGNLSLSGELTIRDNTRPVSLDVEFGGIVVDGYGQTKAGFEMTGKISRKDFGLTWNGLTEAGSVVVGDEVKIIANVQFIKQ